MKVEKAMSAPAVVNALYLVTSVLKPGVAYICNLGGAPLEFSLKAEPNNHAAISSPEGVLRHARRGDSGGKLGN